jgi:hypothetical protein
MSRSTWAVIGLSLTVCVAVALAAIIQQLRQVAKPVSAPPQEVSLSDDYAPTRDDIERDLVLKVETYGSDLHAGEEVGVRDMLVVNTPTTMTHRVVMVGDGSWEGRREPYVYFTGERETVDGRWVRAEPKRWSVCGLFAAYWQKDVVELKPGESLSLGWAITHFDLQHSGRVRIIAHYEYMSETRRNGQNNLPASDRGGMGACPAFHLASSPVTLTVSRPLDLKARAKRTVKAGETVNLSDLFEATVTNTTANPVELVELGANMSCGSHLGIRCEGVEPTILLGYHQVYGRRTMLAAGKTATVFGAGDFSNGADAKVTFPKPGTHRVTVGYGPQVNHGGSIGPYLTAETEVVVDP